jgi:hypothetical protein
MHARMHTLCENAHAHSNPHALTGGNNSTGLFKGVTGAHVMAEALSALHISEGTNDDMDSEAAAPLGARPRDEEEGELGVLAS